MPKKNNDLGRNPVGQIIYDSRGYMSASISTTDPEHIPPDRTPNASTPEDLALLAQHILVYAGGLHVVWENSTATVGRLIHGPLTVSSRPNWLGKNQTRNYIITSNENELDGRDVLHLWLRTETDIANIYWVRAGLN